MVVLCGLEMYLLSTGSRVHTEKAIKDSRHEMIYWAWDLCFQKPIREITFIYTEFGIRL